MDAFIDYYSVLGVSSDASAVAIKAAFKKLALQYHPDVYKGQDAEERMRDLLAAYQTLNDPEKRRKFDVRRSEHIYDEHVPHHAQAERADLQGGRRATTSVRAEASTHARRDRKRHYAFPKFIEGQPVLIDLVDTQYALSVEQGKSLEKLGLLRGTVTEPEQGEYICHRCHQRWPAGSGGSRGRERPRSCPKCQAMDWGDYLLLRCIHCTAVFESEQIRYEIGTYNYGPAQSGTEDRLCPPYELFPLCPYCNGSHWCPAEDLRVAELREAAAKRAAIMRALWFIAIVVAVVILAILVFSLHIV
jgi:rubrerythrin